MGTCQGGTVAGNTQTCFNPYKYGWAWEAKIITGQPFRSTTEVVKHYAMGRLSYKESYVMPDRKTVYSTDTVANGGIFTKFVASAVDDLSQGELFCAKLTQLTPDNRPAHNSKFTIEWRSMGSATDDEIKALMGCRSRTSKRHTRTNSQQA